MGVLSKGFAIGGREAAADALELWAQCAEGNANSSSLSSTPAAYVRLHTAKAGFAAALSLLLLWDGETDPKFGAFWRKYTLESLLRAAGHLLSVCREIEGKEKAYAFFRKEGETVKFCWRGLWTEGRYMSAEISFVVPLRTRLEWDTATGKESTFLSLPSMTDEAETPIEGRRIGGWESRKALPSVEQGQE